MKPVKLRTKLAIIYAGIFALLLAGTIAWFYNLFAYQVNKDLTDELGERAVAVRNFLHLEGDRARLVYDAADPDEAYFVSLATRYYQIYNASSGQLMARSPEMEAIGFQYAPDEVRELIRGPRLSMIQTEQVSLLLHNDLVRSADGRLYLLQVGVSLEPRNAALRRLLQVGLWLIPVGLTATVSLAWWIGGRALRPVLELAAAAKEISISRLDKRLPVRGADDELDQLAVAFNEVMNRLEDSVRQMREFTASISHELRTPLTVLRGEAEVALSRDHAAGDYRRVLESQLEEFEKLSQMINRMLTLARAEAGQITLARDRVCLADLAASAAEQMEPLAASKGVSLTSACEEDIVITGDFGWLERAVLNLLDNAVKFTPRGGCIQLSVHSEKSIAVLEVKDNGAGISAEALPHIFERFYREDSSRSREVEGAGLGLSLVEWIVRQHHGRISVASRIGEGSVFRVELPLAELPAHGQD